MDFEEIQLEIEALRATLDRAAALTAVLSRNAQDFRDHCSRPTYTDPKLRKASRAIAEHAMAADYASELHRLYQVSNDMHDALWKLKAEISEVQGILSDKRYKQTRLPGEAAALAVEVEAALRAVQL